MITLYDRSSHIPLVWTHLIPATLEGRAMHNVQNAMFAAAMAYSLGIKLDAIRQGLRTFDSTFFQAPGRMNVFNEHPFKVLFDYGHNAHAVAAMADLAQRLEVVGRRIVVLAGPGDRRDEDLRAIADAVAGRFDHYICRRDDSLRERAPDEVPKLQAAQLRSRGVPESAISIIPDEQEAIDAALGMGQPGDLLLIFADALIRSWKQIIKFRPAGVAAAAIDTAVIDSGTRPEDVPASGIGGFIAGINPVTAVDPTHTEVMRRGRDDFEDVRGRSRGRPSPHTAEAPEPVASHEAGEGGALMPGLIRDERGVWLAPETDD
jgi:cyanophycin synthetase